MRRADRAHRQGYNLGLAACLGNLCTGTYIRVKLYSQYLGGEGQGPLGNVASPLVSMSEQTEQKRTRKPYTLTKQRESWSAEEHNKFLEALQLFNRDWKKIEAHVGTKTVVQVCVGLNLDPHVSELQTTCVLKSHVFCNNSL